MGEPIATTEALAYDFLAKGGKYSRPFITLAVHDAMTGGAGTAQAGAEHLAGLPAAIYRAAMSIETFHKASLVHDDVEDDDAYRYGEETLHRRYGIPTAINVGDYLIGMGYRLVSRESKSLGPETVSDIVDCLADDTVLPYHGEQLRQAVPGAESWSVDVCEHTMIYRDYPAEYEARLLPFFAQSLD